MVRVGDGVARLAAAIDDDDGRLLLQRLQDGLDRPRTTLDGEEDRGDGRLGAKHPVGPADSTQTRVRSSEGT